VTTTENALRVDGVAAFLDASAAKVPAPGGGATAALHLGRAAALVAMVARYTVGARYSEHQAPVDDVCADADGAIVVDVGTTATDDGTLLGDVDAASVEGRADGLTPVPGGVGPVATALLLADTVTAATALSTNTHRNVGVLVGAVAR
jgi:Tetrahydrofolate dehydrogenase/cyclohydrolase, NAD(P)-binding domain/Formiminotransferase-cyclodeaminase